MSGLDGSTMKFGMHRNPRIGKLDHRRHAVTNAMRLEAGEVVGDNLRQHGDHLIRQVNTGRPSVGFVVQVTAIRNKMRNVSDMNAEFPVSVFKFFQRDRVVEVTSGFRIDGDHGRVGKVRTIADVVFVKVRRLLARVLQNVFGKLLRQTILIDNALRIDPRFASVAKNLDDDGFPRFMFGWEVHHFDNHFVTDATVLRAGISDEHTGIKSIAVDNHNPQSVGFLVAANEAVGVASDHFDYSSRRPA